MSKATLFSPLLAALACAACGDDDPAATASSAPLTIAFEGTVGTEPLALQLASYEAPGVAGGYQVSRLSFFLSEVELLSEVEGEVLGTDVAEVAYVELGTDGQSSFTADDVPVGAYTGLRFNLGLTAEQDAQQPVDYAPGHPLADPAEYWVDWGSYVFLKIEGRADTLDDGLARFDQGFVYHVGRAAEYTRRLEVRTPITVAADGAGAATALAVDLEELLGLRTADPVSLTGVADHTNDAAERIMDNAQRAFTRRD